MFEEALLTGGEERTSMNGDRCDPFDMDVRATSACLQRDEFLTSVGIQALFGACGDSSSRRLTASEDACFARRGNQHI
jgi:hypothetical protein